MAARSKVKESQASVPKRTSFTDDDEFDPRFITFQEKYLILNELGRLFEPANTNS